MHAQCYTDLFFPIYIKKIMKYASWGSSSTIWVDVRLDMCICGNNVPNKEGKAKDWREIILSAQPPTSSAHRA
jgi:hypothetical protein